MTDISQIVITKIISALTVTNPKFLIRHKYARKSHALCFAKSGKMTYRHKDCEYISDQRHALIIPMGASYTSSCSEPGEFPLINFLTTPDFSPDTFISFEIDSTDSYSGEFAKLEKISVIKPKSGHLNAMKMLYEILYRLYKSEITAKDKNIFNVITPAVKYLEEHFTDPTLNNEMLASQALISEIYFRRMFKAKYDISPKQYIQNLRIKKAEDLLCSEYLSITTIAEMTGYASVYHFSRSFKKATGYTPTEYVRQFGISAAPHRGEPR